MTLFALSNRRGHRIFHRLPCVRLQDVAIPEVSLRYSNDLINVFLVARVKCMQSRNIERNGVSPANASRRRSIQDAKNM